jgi:hypothetical protein
MDIGESSKRNEKDRGGEEIGRGNPFEPNGIHCEFLADRGKSNIDGGYVERRDKSCQRDRQQCNALDRIVIRMHRTSI